MTDFHIIGKRIKSFRKKCGLSQSNLAELLDVSISYISQIERGVAKVSLNRLDEISTLINTDVEHLIVGSDITSPRFMDAELCHLTENWPLSKKKLLLKIASVIDTD